MEGGKNSFGMKCILQFVLALKRHHEYQTLDGGEKKPQNKQTEQKKRAVYGKKQNM